MADVKNLPLVELAVIVMDDRGGVLIGRVPNGFDKDKLSVPISSMEPFESMSDASKRIAIEWAGLKIEPQHALFVCESINEKTEEHRIVVFIFAKRAGNIEQSETAFWVDVRQLGDYQDEMSNIAVDGFYKLSLVLRQQAAAADSGPKQA